MLKNYRWMTLSIACFSLTAGVATAQEPDYPCYFGNRSGQTINLSKLCNRSTGVIASPDRVSPDRVSAQTGQVSLVRFETSTSSTTSRRRQSGQYAVGTIQNNTTGRISSVLVTYRVVDQRQNSNGVVYGEVVNDSGSIEVFPIDLAPGETGTFKSRVSRNGIPKVSKIEWTNEDGTYGSTFFR